MEIPVKLSISGKQTYQDEQPEEIEFITDGILEKAEDGWRISYEETELTGLLGVKTSLFVQPGEITLSRTGKLNSQMVFQEGVVHDSLYQMEFGALMMSVMASKIYYDISESGGVIDLVYAIEIENTSAGVIEYHLEIKA